MGADSDSEIPLNNTSYVFEVSLYSTQLMLSCSISILPIQLHSETNS